MEKEEYKMPLWKLLIIVSISIVTMISLMFIISSLLNKGRVDYSNTKLSVEEYKQKYNCVEIEATICGFNSIGMRNTKYYTVGYINNGRKIIETLVTEPCNKRLGTEYYLIGTKYQMLAQKNTDSTVSPLVIEFDKPIYPGGKKSTHKCKISKVVKDNQWYIRVFYQWNEEIRVGAIPYIFYERIRELRNETGIMIIDCYENQKHATYVNIEETFRNNNMKNVGSPSENVKDDYLMTMKTNFF